eukprot:CAMPEP_0168560998 /NCGR_PEP_ID=MMETSP0413-20121227/11356_1 /TAXON_ID=136452 /ORGANISM="Filamoeba nolandi, Strain NC-AS-23-1" /LENGTH=127 /DNA_ID=CAMNT_0008592331 /DNA_START=291 /DNA_END=674 /DNA_ORIENTATION=-
MKRRFLALLKLNFKKDNSKKTASLSPKMSRSLESFPKTFENLAQNMDKFLWKTSSKSLRLNITLNPPLAIAFHASVDVVLREWSIAIVVDAAATGAPKGEYLQFHSTPDGLLFFFWLQTGLLLEFMP